MFYTFYQPKHVKMAFAYNWRQSSLMILSRCSPMHMHRKELKAHLVHTRALFERSSELLITFEELLYDERRRQIVPLWVVWPMYSLTYAFHCALYGRVMDLDHRLGGRFLDRLECVRIRYGHRIRYCALSQMLGLYIPIYNLGR